MPQVIEFGEPIRLTKDNIATTAAVAAGALGLLVGGSKLAGVAFLASSYVGRKRDDDWSKAMESFGSYSLESVNWFHTMLEKHKVHAAVDNNVPESTRVQLAGLGLGEKCGSFLHAASETASNFVRDA
eukprot:4407927-Amphidinium_carterae.1